MQKQDVQKHFLALMKRPGDYSFISVSKLDIADSYSYDSLMNIDRWTMQFTQEEIIESIRRANIVPAEYLMGTLVIQDNQKHNPLIVIDKQYYDNFKIDDFLHKVISNKLLLNTVINKYNSIFNDENDLFAEYLKSGLINQALDILFMKSYLDIRKFMIYLIELRNKEREKDKNKELIRDKAA